MIETVLGRAERPEVFPAGKKDKAAGPARGRRRYPKGLMRVSPRGCHRLQDDHLRRCAAFKDDVPEVRAGLECGVLLADTNDIKAGDHLEVFEVEERARTL
jgi:translation initiation factor IF-2